MSENISEALAYAVELREKQEVIFKEEGKTFYDTSKASLKELFPKKYAGTLEVNSLTGLIQYLQSMFDQDAEKPDSLIIHVESPTKVSVLGKLDEERRRESLIAANAELDVFPYKNFLDQERFKINMMSLFDRTDDAEAILAFASAIRLEGSSDLRDDGISQMATVKTGASTVGDGVVPSPAVLKPYRTFLEVDQPESSFIFRINDRGDCALFEADGGLWKSTAKDSVKSYLESHLKDLVEKEVITVIA